MLRIDGQPCGLGRLPDGRLLVVSMLDHLLLRQEHDGTVVVHADVSAFSRYRSNDMLVDGEGRAYVRNFGFDTEAPPPADPTTCLSRVDPDVSVTQTASGR